MKIKLQNLGGDKGTGGFFFGSQLTLFLTLQSTGPKKTGRYREAATVFGNPLAITFDDPDHSVDVT